MADIKIPVVGKPAPAFKLPASGGKTISLDDFAAKKTVVLYFYPKADTPGCTKEACGFRDALAEYDKAKIAVLGISPDPVADVQAFADKFHLNFPLLADADHAVAERYGAWVEKQNYGKTYWGVARTTFVIGKDGKILHVCEKVKPEGHDVEILAWMKENANNSLV
jgi:peroxiredoxin Q/BCP